MTDQKDVQKEAKAEQPSAGQGQQAKVDLPKQPLSTPPASGTPAEAGQHKKQKINRMTLKEVEKKLQEVQEKMKGQYSSFARQLLKRKEQLLGEKETRNQSTETSIQGKEEAATSGGESAEKQ